nr:PLP-dependent aminotransferase family protein [Burkholderia multivorans]
MKGRRVKRYEQLADDLHAQIERGVYRPGDRIPSVRHASRQHRLSVTTVLRAYLLLESRGLIESRPQSGYFVRARLDAPVQAELHASTPAAEPSAVDVSRLVLSTLRSIARDDAVPLGSPYPDASQFPVQRLARYAQAIGRRRTRWGVIDDLPPGNQELIRQIARRYAERGIVVEPGEIVMTIGATEAINLCLQAVAKPGDTIAVESPTFYAMLHAIERLGMRALEVATHPADGIDIDALARILEREPVAACMVMPNFQNPLGFRMPDERKRALVELLAKHGVPAIESDVYHELYYGDAAPSALKSFDRDGLVLHCASFTKSLSPRYRIGWAMPGRYRDRVEKLKFLNTLATPAIEQLAIAEYLQYDGYDFHLRRMRKHYAQQANLMSSMVRRFFPDGTRLSQPQGGYVLWVELPPQVDAMKLYALALAQRITVGPGHMFSAGADYRHFIRLNYSYPWSRQMEEALKVLGRLAAECAAA